MSAANDQRATGMAGQMGSISGIIDESTHHENLNRVTTGLNQVRQTSREDANLLLFLQENEENGVYLHDMGQMDDTERSHLIIDQDTKLVYDVRKDMDMARLER